MDLTVTASPHSSGKGAAYGEKRFSGWARFASFAYAGLKAIGPTVPTYYNQFVMAGLVPAIHVLDQLVIKVVPARIRRQN